MIQRPQSIFLLIVISALLALAFISTERVQATGILEVSLGNILLPYLLMSMLSLIAVGVAMCALLRYNHRGLQHRLGILNTLLMVVLMGLAIYFTMQKTTLLLCAVALVSNWLASHYIRRDDRLVKESDRIR
jgi:Domain of unknown function (DUF4293)